MFSFFKPKNEILPQCCECNTTENVREYSVIMYTKTGKSCIITNYCSTCYEKDKTETINNIKQDIDNIDITDFIKFLIINDTTIFENFCIYQSQKDKIIKKQ